MLCQRMAGRGTRQRPGLYDPLTPAGGIHSSVIACWRYGLSLNCSLLALKTQVFPVLLREETPLGALSTG